VFEESRCATCHSVDGKGNPRHPLDDLGRRRAPGELADWIVGRGAAAERLSASVVARKQRYGELPVEDLQALIAYLTAEEAPK
jgi:hypothetical protein